MADALSVTHDPAAQRFVAAIQGQEAFLAYRRQGGTLDLYHTFVPEAFRGRGIAERLCQAAFEFARAKQLTVIPSCPYISGAYLKRHAEYESLTRRT